jgi:hypothetical protein
MTFRSTRDGMWGILEGVGFTRFAILQISSHQKELILARPLYPYTEAKAWSSQGGE